MFFRVYVSLQTAELVSKWDETHTVDLFAERFLGNALLLSDQMRFHPQNVKHKKNHAQKLKTILLFFPWKILHPDTVHLIQSK